MVTNYSKKRDWTQQSKAAPVLFSARQETPDSSVNQQKLFSSCRAGRDHGGKRRGGDLTAVAGLTLSLRAVTWARAGEQKKLYGSKIGGCIHIPFLSEAT